MNILVLTQRTDMKSMEIQFIILLRQSLSLRWSELSNCRWDFHSLILGQGYRFPSMAELFVTTNVSDIEIFPNPELRSEKGWSSEIGLKQAVRLGRFRSFIDIAAFIMRYDDMMEFTFGQWGNLNLMKMETFQTFWFRL